MLRRKLPTYYVGLMSGTSLDGIDAALIESDGQAVQLHQFETFELPVALQQNILALNIPAADEIDRMGSLDRALAVVFADAALQVIKSAGLRPEQITAIASHGQTLRHRPQGIDGGHPFTLQIGCAASIAEQTGITVVSDFRRRDIAAQGQGAPLVPFVHQRLFAQPNVDIAVLNIGGIANVTYLGGDGVVLGFDTGPGNMLMDGLMQLMTKGRQYYDKNGALAACGQLDQPLLDILLAHPFLKLVPPRSTGREDFGQAVLEQVMAVDLTDADKMATVCEFTAQSIQRSIQYLPATPQTWILCGGGVLNQYLLQRLRRLLAPQAVRLSDGFGFKAEAVEAVAFALLAESTLKGEANVIAGVTGATHDVCGGQITPGNNWINILKAI